MKLNNFVKIIERDHRVVLVNTCTRDWYKMSKEIFDILKYGIENEYSRSKFLSILYDGEDREILLKVINNLRRKGIILEDDDKESQIELNFTMAITDRCNLICNHCSYNANYCQNTTERITSEQMRERLNKILLLDPVSITFTGGEPMVREDFISLSEWVRTRFDRELALMTNGTLITEENVQSIIKTFSKIDISIDGVDENTCSQIRGKGVFSRVLKSVDLLQKNGFDKISLSMVDTHITHAYVEKFYDLNQRLGTHPVLRSFSAVGRGAYNKNQLQLQKSDYLEKPISLSEELKIKYQKNIKSSGCGAGKGIFFIDYDGSVYGCATLRELGYKLGDIDEIEKVIRFDRNVVYKEMIGNIPKKCKNCDVNIFCIECLADFLSVENDFEMFCNKRKKFLDDIIWKRGR